ncbi:hypothetical protein D2V07_13950 [Aurantiacibacter zhengii]|uniref:Uncharacterized protein n=2 Tax=Aurantiacibacter zhengii TaxID=2307003 RepID=A0A418NQL8_9SPHN|nr:hypothetical protein D2V07_13950 [Aurantiacibacter zhengii]
MMAAPASPVVAQSAAENRARAHVFAAEEAFARGDLDGAAQSIIAAEEALGSTNALIESWKAKISFERGQDELVLAVIERFYAHQSSPQLAAEMAGLEREAATRLEQRRAAEAAREAEEREAERRAAAEADAAHARDVSILSRMADEVDPFEIRSSTALEIPPELEGSEGRPYGIPSPGGGYFIAYQGDYGSFRPWTSARLVRAFARDGTSRWDHYVGTQKARFVPLAELEAIIGGQHINSRGELRPAPHANYFRANYAGKPPFPMSSAGDYMWALGPDLVVEQTGGARQNSAGNLVRYHHRDGRVTNGVRWNGWIDMAWPTPEGPRFLVGIGPYYSDEMVMFDAQGNRLMALPMKASGKSAWNYYPLPGGDLLAAISVQYNSYTQRDWRHFIVRLDYDRPGRIAFVQKLEDNSGIPYILDASDDHFTILQAHEIKTFWRPD